MKSLFLIVSIALISASVNAEVINKTGKSLNACELAAVHQAGLEQGLYSGPNEPLAELNSIQETADNNYRTVYDIQFKVIFDGDMPTNSSISTSGTAQKGYEGLCILPAISYPILGSAYQEEPKSKCVYESPADAPVYCNPNLKYQVQSLGIDYYFTREASNSELNQVFVDLMLKRLITHRPDKFDVSDEELAKIGEFEVQLAQQKLDYKEYIAVTWLDIDDDSYTAFFETEYPNEMIYLYYEN